MTGPDSAAGSEIDVLAETLRVLGHATRLRLLDTLARGGEQSVSALEASTGIGQPALSQQLAVLRKAELVETRRVAKQVYYSLAPDGVRAAARLLSHYAGFPIGGNAPPTTQESLPVGRGAAATFARML